MKEHDKRYIPWKVSAKLALRSHRLNRRERVRMAYVRTFQISRGGFPTVSRQAVERYTAVSIPAVGVVALHT